MGRKSHIEKYLNKNLGGISILEKLNIRDGRMWVKCFCLTCRKEFEAQFHNVYRGNYKSCGCLQHAEGNKNPKWSGIGKISKSYFESLKRGAKNRGLVFNITIQQIWNLFLKQNQKCALSGKSLFFAANRKDTTQNASLDRINAEIGYEINNIQWIDKDINYMKQSMDNNQFKHIVKEIYEYNFK
jgi:hypothetical protein